MSQNRKAKPLRQTTLLNASPRLPCAPDPNLISPTRLKQNRNALLPQPESDAEDNEGLSSIKFESKISSSRSDDGITSPPKKRKLTIVLSDDSDDRAPVKTRPRRRTKARKSDEDDDTQQPRRRKLVKKCTTTLDSSSDNEDLAEEVEKEHILSIRLRRRDKKTAFQRNLEKLKRKKQGKPPESSSDESKGSSKEEDTPLRGAKPSSGYDSLFDADSDSSHPSDFIVEDHNANAATLPMQFSMESHQDLDHQFKKIFQFFVHIATRPAKERHYFMKEQLQREEYFSVPLQMVRRKLSGLRDSLVASSVWRPEYKESLNTYPEFDLIALNFAVPECDACHLGGRLSTRTGRLSGFPYDRWGFEIKDKNQHSSSASDGSESDSARSDDEAFSVELRLGRFCARRTAVYHRFTHWEYALFKSIRDEVDELHANRQSKGFFRVAYAGGLEPPDDLDDADGICEWLDQRKVIDMEWKKLKDMMDDARSLDLDWKKKGDDDDYD